MLSTRILFAGLAGICLIAAANAAPITLNVKMGLWEMSMSGKASGAMPVAPEMLARMTPAQRAKMEAAMAQSMAAMSAPHTYKECLTQKSMQQGFTTEEEKRGNACKETVLTSTATVMDLRQECGGRTKNSTHVRFEALNSETVNGTIDTVMSEGGHTMTMQHRLHGRWLGGACGNVKPRD